MLLDSILGLLMFICSVYLIVKYILSPISQVVLPSAKIRRIVMITLLIIFFIYMAFCLIVLSDVIPNIRIVYGSGRENGPFFNLIFIIILLIHLSIYLLALIVLSVKKISTNKLVVFFIVINFPLLIMHLLLVADKKRGEFNAFDFIKGESRELDNIIDKYQNYNTIDSTFINDSFHDTTPNNENLKTKDISDNDTLL